MLYHQLLHSLISKKSLLQRKWFNNRRKNPREMDPHKWNNNPPLGWIRQSRGINASNKVSLWGTRLMWGQSSRMRWVHWRSLKSREWSLIGLNTGWIVRSIKPVIVPENRGDLLPFFAARDCSVHGFGILTDPFLKARIWEFVFYKQK